MINDRQRRQLAREIAELRAMLGMPLWWRLTVVLSSAMRAHVLQA